MSSLRPIGRSAATLDVGRFAVTLDKDRLSACHFAFADGRQCGTPRAGRHPHSPLLFLRSGKNPHHLCPP